MHVQVRYFRNRAELFYASSKLLIADKGIINADNSLLYQTGNRADNYLDLNNIKRGVE